MSPPSRDLPSYEDVGVHATSDTTAVTIPDPLTCAGVFVRRSKAGPFSGGVAAATSSDLFKSKVISLVPMTQLCCMVLTSSLSRL